MNLLKKNPPCFYLLMIVLAFSCTKKIQDQHDIFPKGKLFIIGGGDRSDSMMMVAFLESGILDSGYAMVLPMATSEPDSAFIYFNDQYTRLTGKKAVMLNCDSEETVSNSILDSLKNARFIFLSGGDQSVFINKIKGTMLAETIRLAYANGSTITGTSAGASLMSCVMITGEQLQDTAYKETFDKLITHNLETREGLCLLDSVIIDQHFISRSRYNRMLTGLAEFPLYQYIGVDEGTAILVKDDSATVIGDGQVAVADKMIGTKISASGKISFQDIDLGIYSEGQRFKIKR